MYWIRAWTTQEFISAKEVEIRSGSATMSYETLERRIASMYNLILSLKLSYTEINAKKIFRMVDTRNIWRARWTWDLHHLFEHLEMEHALRSDLRDRIFLIISLEDARTKVRYPMSADYTLSTRALFFKETKRHLSQFAFNSIRAS